MRGGKVLPIDAHPRFRNKAAPEIADARTMMAVEALGLPMPDGSEPRFFRLKRCRDGTDIWLEQGPFGKNLTAYEIAPLGLTFTQAREWARKYAAKHGFIFREKPRGRILT